MPQPIKVLLVDDSRASRMLSCAILKNLRPDVEVVEASDGTAALSLLTERGVDIGILDMNMPGMSGLDLASRILDAHPGTKLALLTANGQDTVKRHAASLGVQFFRKPVTPDVLNEILSKLSPSA
jgi:two-component system, chemotaxis family, chemotaxis protein CheY